jgi:hypothetical protein
VYQPASSTYSEDALLKARLFFLALLALASLWALVRLNRLGLAIRRNNTTSLTWGQEEEALRCRHNGSASWHLVPHRG